MLIGVQPRTCDRLECSLRTDVAAPPVLPSGHYPGIKTRFRLSAGTDLKARPHHEGCPMLPALRILAIHGDGVPSRQDIVPLSADRTDFVRPPD